MKTKSLERTLKVVSPVVKEAQILFIKSPVTLQLAVDILSKLNRLNDSIIEDREKITKPLNQALKEIRSKYKPLEDSLSEAVSLIREKMSAYQTRVTQEAKKKEIQLAERLSKGDISLDQAMEALPQSPSALVVAGAGKVKFKTSYRLKLTDPELLPDAYFSINETLILFDLKAGKAVPGAQLEEIQTPINYR